jgi:hypothetical protein
MAHQTTSGGSYSAFTSNNRGSFGKKLFHVIPGLRQGRRETILFVIKHSAYFEQDASGMTCYLEAICRT